MGWMGRDGMGWGVLPQCHPICALRRAFSLILPHPTWPCLVLPRIALSCLVLHRCPRRCGASGPSVGGRSGVGVGVSLVRGVTEVGKPLRHGLVLVCEVLALCGMCCRFGVCFVKLRNDKITCWGALRNGMCRSATPPREVGSARGCLATRCPEHRGLLRHPANAAGGPRVPDKNTWGWGFGSRRSAKGNKRYRC